MKKKKTLDGPETKYIDFIRNMLVSLRKGN